MQRSRDRLDSYRLLLIRQTDEAFVQFNALRAGRRWGPLDTARPPISQKELVAARAAMLADASEPFVPVRDNIQRVETSRIAIARDAAFRETLLVQYQRQCSVSGIALATHSVAETQAAHIIPLGRGGADEPRNGFTLTGTLHWAFDRGLFGVDDNRRVTVPARVRAMAENAWLHQFHGRAVSDPRSSHLRTANEAFAWHRANLLSTWL
jgi:putative restriction endonuclease